MALDQEYLAEAQKIEQMELDASLAQTRAGLSKLKTPNVRDQDNSSTFFNIAQQVPAGAYEALNNSVRSAEDLAGWLDDNLFGDMVQTDRIFELPDTNELFAEPQGLAAGLTRGASQFLVGFLPALKVVKGLTLGTRILGGTGIGASFGRATLAGAVADFAVWDPKQPRFANLINENIPQLANPITDYLAADDDDTAAEGRFKNVLEGAMLGSAAEGIFRAIRLVKSMRGFTKGAGQGDAKAVSSDISKPKKIMSAEALGSTGRQIDPSLEKIPEYLPDESLSTRYTDPSQSQNLDVMDVTSKEYLNTKIRVSQANKAPFVEDIERATGLVPEVRVKDAGDLAKKIVRHRTANKDPKSVADVLAARVTVPEKEALSTLGKIDAVEHFKTMEVKDFMTGKEVGPLGYRGINVKVRLPGGQVSEFQIHTPETLGKQKAGRHFYERWRNKDITKLTAREVVAHEKDMAASGKMWKEPLPKSKWAALSKKAEAPRISEAAKVKATQELIEITPAKVVGEGSVIGTEKIRVRWDDITTPQQMAGVADEYERLTIKHWTGRQTIDEVVVRANDLGLNVEDVLSKTEPSGDLAAQITARIQLVEDSLNNLKTTLPKVVDGTISEADFYRRVSRHTATYLLAEGRRSELGRTFRMLQESTRGTAGKTRAVSIQIAKLQDLNITGKELAVHIQELFEVSPEAASRYMKMMLEPQWGDIFHEIRINGLLSGVKTQFANFLGNTAGMILAPTERALATSRLVKWMGVRQPLAVAHSLESGAVRGEARVMVYSLMSDSAAATRASVEAIWDSVFSGWSGGFRLLGKGLKTIKDEPLQNIRGQKIDLPRYRAVTSDNIKRLIQKGPVSKRVYSGLFGELTDDTPIVLANFVDWGGKIMRLPGRLLMKADDMFKSLNYNMEANALAHRTAIKEGLTGAQYTTRVSDLVTNPNMMPEIHQLAEEAMFYRTYTNEIPATNKILRVLGEHPVAHHTTRILFPFIRTPTNLFLFSIERTPGLNLAFKSMRQNLLRAGTQGDLARGKMAFGVMFATSIAYLAGKNLITGSGPQNPAMRKIWLGQNNQPYSIKIGEKTYSYNRLDPVGMTLGMVADFTLGLGKLPEKTAMKLGMLISVSISENALSKTYVRSAAEFFEVLKDPRRAPRFVRETTLSFTPFSSALRETERQLDPALSEARTLLEEALSQTPLWSRTLPPVRDLKGDPAVLPPGFGPYGIVPIFVGEIKKDPVWRALVENQIAISSPTDFIKGRRVPEFALEERTLKDGIRLTPEQFDEYQVLAGNGLKINGRGMWDTQAWFLRQADVRNLSGGPDGMIALEMRRIVASFRQAALTELINRHPDLEQKIISLERKRTEALLGRPIQ